MNGPQSRIVAAADAATTVTDALGRRLVLRRLGALEKLRLFKAVGPQLGQNEPYLAMALLACAVAAIDDLPLPAPANEAQIEMVVQKLGDEGLAAVAGAFRAANAEKRTTTDSAKN
jgi:hypothetical protein